MHENGGLDIRSAQRQNMLLGMFCLLTMALSAWSVQQEMLVRDSQIRANAAVLSPPAYLPLAATDLPSSAPPRAYMLEALHIGAVVAANAGIADRTALLDRARYYIDHVENVRPHWAEMWVVKSFIASLSSPDFKPVERDALIRSYLDAPYLHSTGRWRAQRALAHWNAFPPFTQDRIAKETVWLFLTSSGRNPTELLQAARNSDAYIPVFRELRRATR